MATSFLEAALEYAAKGLRVFPLKPGRKVPIHMGGFKNATTDPEQIRKWWKKSPSANIGIATGQTSGIAVLDVDVKKEDGEASLREMINGHGALPETLEHTTPSGGRHLIFAVGANSIKSSAGELGPGLDVRGEGGYIVAPPSVIGEDSYKVGRGAKLAPIPQWFAALTSATPSRSKAKIPTSGVAPGTRNNALTSHAGILRGHGLEVDEIEQALQAKNQLFCNPPLPPSEVKRIAQSVAQYPAGHPFTDTGNAQRLADAIHEAFKFCPQTQRWLVRSADGTRYRYDDDGAVVRAMQQVVREMITAAALMRDTERRKYLLKWSATSGNEKQIKAAVRLASVDNRVLVPLDQLDADPMSLGVQNGVVDLKTGKPSKPNPGVYVVKQAGTRFDPRAKCPIWLKFLDRIFAGDKLLLTYIQTLAGYLLTGNTMERVFFFLHGIGANGKSTFIGTLQSLMGEYASKVRSEIFMRAALVNASGPTSERAALRGKRLVIASELSDTQRFEETLLKDLSGGIDRISARDNHAQPTEFKPDLKLFFVGNKTPQLRADDSAIWSRLHLIPFREQISRPQQDPKLADKLSAELSGILNWAIEGCLRWQSTGLGLPDGVRQAVSDYHGEQDLVGQFVEECCVVNESAAVRGGTLYQEYQSWAVRNGHHRVIANNRFAAELASKGFHKTLSGGTARWIGIGLRHSEGR